MDLTIVADQLAIERVLAEYCRHCDDGDFAALIGCFTPDGCFEFGDEAAVGPAALQAFFERTQPPHRRGTHITVNTVVDIDGTGAQAVSDYVFLVLRDGRPVPLLAGRYRDELRRDDGRWRIARRVASVMAPPE